MTLFTDSRPKFIDLDTQSRLDELGRCWILADSDPDFDGGDSLPIHAERCELHAPELGLSKGDAPWPRD